MHSKNFRPSARSARLAVAVMLLGTGIAKAFADSKDAPPPPPPSTNDSLDSLLNSPSAGAPAPSTPPAPGAGDSSPSAAPDSSQPAPPNSSGTPPAAPSETATVPTATVQPPADGGPVESRLYQGAYSDVMGSYLIGKKSSGIGNGFGGVVGFGYRRDIFAIEANAILSRQKSDIENAGKIHALGGGINGLLFPFHKIPGLYAIVGLGGQDIRNYSLNVPATGLTPASTSVINFSTVFVSGGLGYMQRIHIGHYDFGIRAEAQYRHSKREHEVALAGDPNAPLLFNDVVFNLGLQLPLGRSGASSQ